MTRARLPIVAALFLVLIGWQQYAHVEEIERLKADRTVEFAAAVAEGVARTMRPAPPVCVEYRVHMERVWITHCMKPGIRM